MKIDVELNSVIVTKRDNRNYHVDFRLDGIQPDFETTLAFDDTQVKVNATLCHTNVSGGVFCELCRQNVALDHSPCPGYSVEVIGKVLEVANVDRPNWRVYTITH